MNNNFKISTNKISHDIYGSPYTIGEKVIVLSNVSNDCTFDDKFIGLIGKIEYFDFECGCGQTYPTDPMIGVKFLDNSIEEFWNEELLSLD